MSTMRRYQFCSDTLYDLITMLPDCQINAAPSTLSSSAQSVQGEGDQEIILSNFTLTMSGSVKPGQGTMSSKGRSARKSKRPRRLIDYHYGSDTSDCTSSAPTEAPNGASTGVEVSSLKQLPLATGSLSAPLDLPSDEEKDEPSTPLNPTSMSAALKPRHRKQLHPQRSPIS